MLQVKNIEKYYGSKNHVTKALDRVSFDVEKGEFIAIMGASGSGKTTLLNCISTIDTVSAGSIVLEGTEISELAEGELARFRRERLGFVFQDFNLLDTLTIEENIGLALMLNHSDPRFVQKQVTEVCEKLGITDILGKFPYQVSGGQKQRISLARALAVRPAILILDDTTSAVDMETEKQIQHSLNELDFPCTKIIIAQRISTTKYADKILVLQDGRITESGSHEELIAKKGYYYQVVQLQTGQQISEQSRDVSGAYAECGKEV